MTRIRKNYRTLTASERSAFVNALLELKKNGEYDKFVEWHHHAMMCPTPMPGENPHWRFRNAAHRGPVFLPWHRDYINELELRLQKINSSVTLPYWDWTEDAALSDPGKSPLWADDFMGGTGVREGDFEVTSGPFAFKSGNWTIPKELDGPKLRRGFGEFTDPVGAAIKTLPTKDDVKLLFEEVVCDAPPWNSAASTIGFRNRLEGWVTKTGDYRIKTDGVQLHNRVHVWIGGTMARPVSPGDPVFFLHHCFVDKIWVDWVAAMQAFYNDPHGHHGQHFSPPIMPSPGYYLPVTGGPPGHNLFDRMFPPPWDMHRSRSPFDVVEHRALGYRYDTEPDSGGHPHHHEHALQSADHEMRAFTA